MRNYIKTNILSLGQHLVFLFFFLSESGNCQEYKFWVEKKEALSSNSVQLFMLCSLAVYFHFKHLAFVVAIQASYLIKTHYFLSYCSVN